MHIHGAVPGGALPIPIIAPAAPVATTTTPAVAEVASSLLGSDTVGTSLQQMAEAPVSQLITGVQVSHPPVDPVLATNLIHTAATAVIDGNIPAAMVALTELVHRSPEHVETLLSESSLSPIRMQVQDLLTKVTTAAKVEAEVRLATATQAVDSPHLHGQKPSDWNPREVLSVASQLIDSGRHTNILMSTDLSQAVINYYGGFEIATPRSIAQRGGTDREPLPLARGEAPWNEAVEGVSALVSSIWRRAPAMVLLFIWGVLTLMAAVAAGIELWSVDLSLEVWGVGSAGLLGFGTYRRVRK